MFVCLSKAKESLDSRALMSAWDALFWTDDTPLTSAPARLRACAMRRYSQVVTVDVRRRTTPPMPQIAA